MKEEKATLDQASHIVKLINDKGLTREQLQKVIDSGLFSDVLETGKSEGHIDREVVQKALGLEPLLSVYNVVVDYNLSLVEMIKAGKYDWVNDGITQKHFPLQEKGLGKIGFTITLLHLNRYISSDEAIEKISEAGYRPATLPELLALGESQPELQRQFPIVALGSVWQCRGGPRCVPYLWYDGSERRLDLTLFERDWSPHYRFAVARK